MHGCSTVSSLSNNSFCKLSKSVIFCFVYFTLDPIYKVKSLFIILLIGSAKSLVLSKGTQISFHLLQNGMQNTEGVLSGSLLYRGRHF